MNTPADFSPQIHTVLNGISPLPQLGLIQAQGEDAAHFLHNQLSNDVLLLPVGQSRLAAFCSAKGRMQASFILVKTAPDTVLLVLSLDLLAQTLKRLSMFVMRAKVKMSDATDQWQMRGLLGDSAHAVLAEATPWQTPATTGPTPWHFIPPCWETPRCHGPCGSPRSISRCPLGPLCCPMFGNGQRS